MSYWRWQLDPACKWLGYFLLGAVLLICISNRPLLAQTPASFPDQISPVQIMLPAPQVHPLPASLAAWQAPNYPQADLSAGESSLGDYGDYGDYFDQIEPTPAGYLIWSSFPVRVFVQPADPADQRSQSWQTAVQQAMQEWSVYLPLVQTNNEQTANIQIWRTSLPLQPLAPAATPDQPLIDRLPRVRAAETRYEIFLHQASSNTDSTHRSAILSHRFTIHLTPNQTADYTRATARHEIGHALGIWGHSPVATDALYFSQVRSSPAISVRDINTLKRIYQQPTQFGWPLLEADRPNPESANLH